jgi:phospholipid/cholesterol/gamma-HCH transport system permease protein
MNLTFRLKSFFEFLGKFYFFVLDNFLSLREKFFVKAFFEQLYTVGVESFGVVTLTGIFTGMVFVVQVGFNFTQMGAQSYIGGIVALALMRELSPVLVAIIIAGRVGSAMAAEIGTMKISEQIDALKMLSVNPFSYLTMPRILATVIMMPILVIYSNFLGMVGGALVAVYQVGITLALYKNSIIYWVEKYDLFSGLFKALIFGFIIAAISCFKGVETEGGAKGVGQAATSAVVISITSILVVNYFVSVLLKYVYIFLYE